jgi:hypothetical protein
MRATESRASARWNRLQDLDPAHRTTTWKDAEKLAYFVTEGLRAAFPEVPRS